MVVVGGGGTGGGSSRHVFEQQPSRAGEKNGAFAFAALAVFWGVLLPHPNPTQLHSISPYPHPRPDPYLSLCVIRN